MDFTLRNWTPEVGQDGKCCHVHLMTISICLKHKTRLTERVCTLHLHRGGRGRGAMVIGCYARINPAVLRHQIADLQGDVSGLTRETKRKPQMPIRRQLMVLVAECAEQTQAQGGSSSVTRPG